MVESLQTTTHSRPEMRPTPVMIPAALISSSYMPLAASGDSSRNGVPGSISVVTRSRGSNLPRARWRSRARADPPSAALARRVSSSTTSARIAAWLASNSFDAVSMLVAMAVTNPPETGDLSAYFLPLEDHITDDEQHDCGGN